MRKPNPKIKFTYEDYKNLPPSETKRYELLEGELITVPSPTTYHQRISGNLSFVLWAFIKKQDLGTIYHAPLDVHLGEDVVQPDILFISRDRYHIIGKEEVQGAPDLIIEILSPATAEYDRTYKRTLYARYGAGEYWLVDPEKKEVEVLKLSEKGYQTAGIYHQTELLKSPLLSGLSLNLSDVF